MRVGFAIGILLVISGCCSHPEKKSNEFAELRLYKADLPLADVDWTLDSNDNVVLLDSLLKDLPPVHDSLDKIVLENGESLRVHKHPYKGHFMRVFMNSSGVPIVVYTGFRMHDDRLYFNRNRRFRSSIHLLIQSNESIFRMFNEEAPPMQEFVE